MTPVRAWKRFVLCACSHGRRVDPTSADAVLDFKRRYKPHTVWHLGDVFDFAALRSGAKGTGDEAEDLQEDIAAATKFITALEPQCIFEGNHEVRVHKLIEQPNALLRTAGLELQSTIARLCQKVKAKWVPYDIEFGWRPLGDMLVSHGYMFNNNALVEHATTFGKCAIGHLHICDQVTGFRPGAPTAYCTGTLCDIPSMGYARTRKSTLRWSAGFLWGEYCGNEAVVWLCKRTHAGEWRLPI